MDKENLHVLINRKPDEKNLNCLKEKLLPSFSLHFMNENYDPNAISILVSGRTERSIVEKLIKLKYMIIPFAGKWIKKSEIGKYRIGRALPEGFLQSPAHLRTPQYS